MARVFSRNVLRFVQASAVRTSPIARLVSAPIIHQRVPLMPSFSRVMSTGIIYPPAEAKIGRKAPDFTAPAVINNEISQVSLSSYRGKWVVLFFYPKDFTFVCPTEIIAFSDRAKEFEALDAQVVAVSTDTEETHLAWTRTPRKRGGLGLMQIPIVADTTKTIANQYGVLIEEAGIALRGLFLINPEGELEQITVNNLPVGRNVDETLRLLQAFQYVRKHGEVCPANWKPGALTMKAHPDQSLEYFASGATEEDPDEVIKGMDVVKSPDHYREILKSNESVVMCFMAPWCGKCQQIKPHVAKLIEEHPNVKFAKFDTSEAGLDVFGTDLGVKNLPAFRFYKNGIDTAREISGYKKAPLTNAVKNLAQA